MISWSRTFFECFLTFGWALSGLVWTWIDVRFLKDWWFNFNRSNCWLLGVGATFIVMCMCGTGWLWIVETHFLDLFSRDRVILPYPVSSVLGLVGLGMLYLYWFINYPLKRDKECD